MCQHKKPENIGQIRKASCWTSGTRNSHNLTEFLGYIKKKTVSNFHPQRETMGKRRNMKYLPVLLACLIMCPVVSAGIAADTNSNRNKKQTEASLYDNNKYVYAALK